MRLGLAILLLACSCSVDVDLHDVPCDIDRPCAPGWSCTDGVCLDCVDQNDPAAAIQVTNLRAEWTTPESIQWRWEVEGSEGALDHYELVLGTSADGVCYRDASARVITPEDHPELGELSFRMTSAVNLVDHAIVDQLSPASSFFARLIAIDTSGRRSVTQIAGDSTQEEAAFSFPVFSGDLDNGWYLMQFERAVDAAGSGYLELRQACDEGRTECWTNASLLNDTPQVIVGSSGELTRGQFGNAAFLELSMSVQTGVRARYGEIKLRFGGSCDLYFLAPYAMPADGQSRKVQAPLRAFVNLRACDGRSPTDEPLSFDQASLGLDGVTIGAPWDRDSVIRVDDVRVRW